MFKNFFKSINKTDKKIEEKQYSEIIVKHNEIDKVESQISEPIVEPENEIQVETQISEFIKEPENEVQEINHDVKENTEEHILKATDKLAQYKLIYINKFKECNAINEVLETYVKMTSSEDCFDELRLKYISMFLFSSGLSNDKLSIDTLKSMLSGKLKVINKTEIIEEEILQPIVNNKILIEANEDKIEIETEKIDEAKQNQINQTKASIEFLNLKDFYKPVFSDKKTLDEILKSYIKSTEVNQLFEESRLRFLSMYLFNLAITNERCTELQLKFSINKIINPDGDLNALINDTSLVNDKLYTELKFFLVKHIANIKSFGEEVNLDNILISVFSQYRIQAIEQDFFLKLFLKILNDINFPIAENISMNLKNYLKQRILDIKDTEFWESNEEKIYRCEVMFSGRYIRVKTSNFIREISIPQEGLIFVSATQLNNLSSYSIYINETSFITNIMDRDKILNYFKYVNNEIQDEVNKKIERINEHLTKIPSNLIAMIDNFIGMFPVSMLLDKERYIAFEHLISYNSFLTKQVLDSNSEERNNIVDKLKEDNDLFKSIDYFIDDNYKKFVKIAGKYIDAPEEYHSSIIWILLRKSAIQHFSEQWKNEDGVHLGENDQIFRLDEYVDLYCRCGDIPHKNIGPVGMFTYYLMQKGIFPVELNNNFVKCNIHLINKVFEKLEELELERFENKLTKKQTQKSATYSLNDIDLMDGHEFERFISLLFTKMGYTTEVTRGSGDQGLDILAEKNGVKIGIQAKCYANKVTNKAVQEISTALSHYNCNKGMVVTNNFFTDSAVELAQSNNIILWDRDILKSKLEEIYTEEN